MYIRSTDVLLHLDQPGCYILDELGAPWRADLKQRVVTLKNAEGRDIQIPVEILDDLIREHLVQPDGPVSDDGRRIYRLTPDGRERVAQSRARSRQ